MSATSPCIGIGPHQALDERHILPQRLVGPPVDLRRGDKVTKIGFSIAAGSSKIPAVTPEGPMGDYYDVFLSHASADKPVVEALAHRLRADGLQPFLDAWELIPGRPWQEALEEIPACAVFLGSRGMGPWENEEMRVALAERVREMPTRVIPVLLPGVRERDVPHFLRCRTWVDFRSGLDDEAAYRRLTASIRSAAPRQRPKSAPPLPLDDERQPIATTEARTLGNADILLDVRVTRKRAAITLTFELRIHNPELGDTRGSFHSIVATIDPDTYFQQLLKPVPERPNSEDREGSWRRVQKIGNQLSDVLLPRELRPRLSALAKPVSEGNAPPTLSLLSDETWIPWELVTLQVYERGEDIKTSVFLAEAFALTRWLRGVPTTLELPLHHLALVRAAAAEAATFQLPSQSFEVTEVPSSRAALLQELSSGTYDVWHFAGHGLLRDDNPEISSIELEGGQQLTPHDLSERSRRLGGNRPLVFLNACHAPRDSATLIETGALARSFLGAGAGAIIGTHWAIPEKLASEFASALYQNLIGEQLRLGEATWRARKLLRSQAPDDPSWLAYTVFGHPLAVHAAVGEEQIDQPGAGERTGYPPMLRLPTMRWHPDRSPPGALLRPEFGIVPFQARELEIDDLATWCLDEKRVGVRLYTGAGGMGKTRLALELCLIMRDRGWEAGFVDAERSVASVEAWCELFARREPVLVAVDYAETRRELLRSLLRAAVRAENGPIRLLLLGRAALDWWDQLQMDGDGVGELLSGPVTARFTLAPVALTADDRLDAFHYAAWAFAQVLGQPVPTALPRDLEAPYYDRIQLLHLRALAAVESVEAQGEEGLLDFLLQRERRFWRAIAVERGLPTDLITGIGRAMAAVTLGGGVRNEEDARLLLSSLSFFEGQAPSVLFAVADLMHACYAGKLWIEPVQPTLLGEHLIERELETGSDELLNLVLGPYTT